MNLKDKYEQIFSPAQKNILASVSVFSSKNGINAFLVGGVVRDLILNRPVFDIDIVVETDAVLFVKNLLTELKGEIINVQENLRTAKVLFHNGIEVDFSSTRKETYLSSGQLPVLSEFGCPISDDVKRRDFTINTLCLKLSSNNDFEVIDFLGGINDIQLKQLKILHDKSFIDDPSRLVRLLKFAVRFGFRIERHTKDLIVEYLPQIDNTMPLERIKGELKQLFSLNSQAAFDLTVNEGINKLVSSGICAEFSQNRLNYCIEKGFISSSLSWFVPFSCLCVYSSDYWLRLNLNSKEKTSLNDFLCLLNSGLSEQTDKFKIYQKFSKFTIEAIICEYVSKGSKEAKIYLDEIKDIHVLINGNDLISLGFKPSAQFKTIFDIILKEKFNGKLKSKEEEIEFAKSLL